MLVIESDYPATVLPWQRLARSGVHIRPLRPAGGQLTADELAAAIGPRTRVVAVTWVDSFTGCTLDLQALGSGCRQAGTFLVVNASQALGVRAISVRSAPVDAVVSCGYKWLCGPCATGFAWLSPALMNLPAATAGVLAGDAGRPRAEWPSSLTAFISPPALPSDDM